MLNEFSVLLTPFGVKRTIRVYVPQHYNESNKRYPVLYMHDGQNVFRDQDAVGGISLNLENYLDQNHFELIVVGIDSNNVSEERINEYCPWVNGEFSKRITGKRETTGGRGKPYVDFIVNVLKPLIDDEYRTIPTRTYMAGISLGGLISTYAACCYPNIFKRVAGISSAFFRNQEEIVNFLQHSNLSGIERFYLDCGTEEAVDDVTISKCFLDSNQSIYEILKSKIPDTKFYVANGAEHKYDAFKLRIPDIFSYLFQDIQTTSSYHPKSV